jgi:GntR family transcriptional regulator, transcriptional repressor for pyruvate dehydrogenase complex
MLPKLSRGTLAEQVTDNLLTYIEAQHLKPGDLLPSETSLATSFGVSRPVIREALKNLEGKGIIEIVNGKGAIVKPIDSDPLRLFFQRAMQIERSTIIELMEVRKGVEVEAAILAASRRQPKDLEAIEKTVHAMRQYLHDQEEYTRLDVQFHLMIAKASHNDMIVYLVESIRDALRNTISAGLRSRRSTAELEDLQATHERLLNTLREGNVEDARIIMTLHFDEAISAMRNQQTQSA